MESLTTFCACCLFSVPGHLWKNTQRSFYEPQLFIVILGFHRASDYAVLTWIVPWLSRPPSTGSRKASACGMDGCRILIADLESRKQIQGLKSVCFYFLKIWISFVLFMNFKVPEVHRPRAWGKQNTVSLGRQKKERWTRDLTHWACSFAVRGPTHLLWLIVKWWERRRRGSCELIDLVVNFLLNPVFEAPQLSGYLLSSWRSCEENLTLVSWICFIESSVIDECLASYLPNSQHSTPHFQQTNKQ